MTTARNVFGKWALGLSLLALSGAAGCATTSESEDREVAAPKPKRDKVGEKVAHQAAFDLQCDEADVRVTKISEEMMGQMRTYGARGCGQQATYKVGCSIMGCTVMNEAQARSMAGR
jgi:hypothetical protein